MKKIICILLSGSSYISLFAQNIQVSTVQHMPDAVTNRFYTGNRQPLRASALLKLPVNNFHPKGWLLKQMQLQRNGLTGQLGHISAWLSKTDNAWLNKEGKGKYGWEELPYWLKGFANIGYMLNDPKIIQEAKFWIEAVLNNQRDNGDFGPVVLRNGKRDLWTNMPMLWCLQSYYEYANDARVLRFMSRYFQWELSIQVFLIRERVEIGQLP